MTGEEGELWTGPAIACVDLNAFYSSCEELRNQTLRGKAHAVIMTDQAEGHITKGVVSTCSYEARKYGIRSAMSLAEALFLHPGLILLPVDIPYYSQVSKQVMEILKEFADALEQSSIDEAFLDFTLRRGEYQPEDYAKKIKQAIKEKCDLSCSIGITPTKASAKIAADYRKPDGLTVVYPYNLKKFLEPLDVSSVAGIGPKTQARLREKGIETLGQLASANVQKLIEEFGANGSWMWHVANGKDNEQVIPRGEHISISTESTLSRHTRDKNIIKKVLEELLNEIYERAQRNNYLFRTIGIKIVRTDFVIETRETTFQDFSATKASVSSQIDILMNRFEYSEDRPPVRKVGLKLANLSRSHDLQNAMAIQKKISEFF